MKRFSLMAAVLITAMELRAGSIQFHQREHTAVSCGFWRNGRYVYVASYDGDQFSPNLLPEGSSRNRFSTDRHSKFGKLTLVYRPSEADITILVTSRPSEMCWLFTMVHQGLNGKLPPRVMGRDGLRC